MGLGWGTFFGGLGKILDKLPIQGRKERWKNEFDNLTKEKEELLKGDPDVKKANRIEFINKRIDYLGQLLKNSAND